MNAIRKIFRKAAMTLGRLEGHGWGSFTAAREVSMALSKIGHPNIVVDVGGNIGDWTAAVLHGACPKQIYIIEPSTVNQRLLAQRFQSRSNVTIIPNALSNRDGAAVLFADKSGSGLASLHQRKLDLFNIRHEEIETVEMLSVTTFLKQYSIEQIDILKLDIEGHELAVLKAIPEPFLRKVMAIQFEFGGCNIDSRTFFQDFWYLLSPLFNIYRMSPLGLLKVSQYSISDEVFVTTNYLCIRSDIDSTNNRHT